MHAAVKCKVSENITAKIHWQKLSDFNVSLNESMNLKAKAVSEKYVTKGRKVDDEWSARTVFFEAGASR